MSVYWLGLLFVFRIMQKPTEFIFTKPTGGVASGSRMNSQEFGSDLDKIRFYLCFYAMHYDTIIFFFKGLELNFKNNLHVNGCIPYLSTV